MTTQKIKYNGTTLEVEHLPQYTAKKITQTAQKSRATNAPTIIQQINGFEVIAKPTTTNRTAKSTDTGLAVFKDINSQKLIIPVGDIALQFKTTTTKKDRELFCQKYDLQVVKEYENNTFLVRAATSNVIETAQLIENEKIVKSVEVDFDTAATLYDFILPTDNLLKHQWSFKNNGRIQGMDGSEQELRKGADAKIIEAWTELNSLGSPDIKIAVNDLGFDIAHPDLKTKTLSQSYNMWSRVPLTSQNAYMNSSHGTACAGVAAAAANGKGSVGVAPNSPLLLLEGTGFYFDFFKELVDYCIDKNVAVLSLSWGETLNDARYPLHPIIKQELDRLLTKGRNGKGCLICVAAGNEGTDRINFLATHPNVIAVGATTSRDLHAGYSNMGYELTVTAPAGPWEVVAPLASWGNQHWYPAQAIPAEFDQYTHFGGTSAATPLVAGVCALVLSANPQLTASELKRIIVNTTDKVGFPSEYQNGHSVRYGYGRVNALKAVKMAKTGNIPPLPTANTPPPPTPEPTPATPTYTRRKAIVKDTDTLNVRNMPSASDPNTQIIRKLKKDDVIYISEVKNGWAKLSDEYVSSKYLNITE